MAPFGVHSLSGGRVDRVERKDKHPDSLAGNLVVVGLVEASLVGPCCDGGGCTDGKP